MVVTLPAGGDRHSPVSEAVSQIDRRRGKVAFPVSAVAVILPLAPTFTDATAKALAPEVPGRLRIPSPDCVAPNATTSGTGVFDAESVRVLTPAIIDTGMLLAQSKLSCTSVGLNGAVGTKANINVCSPPVGMSAGVSGAPVRAFVFGSVV